MNGCEHYKVGQFQHRQGQSGTSDSQTKEFATDYSNASFEQCRVVLVWHFYDHKCRHGVMFTRRNATQHVKRLYESL